MNADALTHAEPEDDDALPFAQFARGAVAGDDAGDAEPASSLHTWWFVAAAAAVVVIGLVIGAIVLNRSAPATARGERTAKDAASRFIRVINDGDLAGAAAISCATFADQAKAAATTAKDPAIDFTLDSLRMLDRTNAVATLTEHLTFSATTKQAMHLTIAVQRSSGRWLMCGQAS